MPYCGMKYLHSPSPTGGNCARSPATIILIPPKAMSLLWMFANNCETKLRRAAETIEISSIIIVCIWSSSFLKTGLCKANDWNDGDCDSRKAE